MKDKSWSEVYKKEAISIRTTNLNSHTKTVHRSNKLQLQVIK